MRIIQSQWLGLFLSVRWLICSLHTGWSASNSEPYIRTRFAHLSKSEIFFGNQGTSHISERRRATMSCLLRMQFTIILVMQCLQDVLYLPHVDKSYLEAPYPPRLHAFEAAGWFHSVVRGCCRSPQKFQTQSCVFWIFWTLCAQGWRGFPETDIISPF